VKADDLFFCDPFFDEHAVECDGTPRILIVDNVEMASWWLCKCGQRVPAPEKE
jgi:hypothetical protein